MQSSKKLRLLNILSGLLIGVLLSVGLPKLYARILYWGFCAEPYARLQSSVPIKAVSGWGERLTSNSDGIPWLLRGLKEGSPSVRSVSAGLLGFYGDTHGVVTELIAACSDPDPQVRMQAAEALGHLVGKKTIPSLRHLQKDDDMEVRKRASLSVQAVLGVEDVTRGKTKDLPLE